MPASSAYPWQLLDSTVRGPSHERSGTPNQDAVKVTPLENGSTAVLAVADGHGDRLHERSDRGSRFAIEAATEVLAAWISATKGQPDGAIRHLASELPQILVRTWREKVRKDLADHPLRERASTTSRDPDLIKSNPEILYGSTLVAAALTDRFALFTQIGDGDVLLVEQDGSVSRKVPSPDDLPANLTESLCHEDADQRFRTEAVFFNGVHRPTLVLLSTDGYSNSYGDDEDAFFKVGHDLKNYLERKGVDWVKQNLDGWLKNTTRTGSGDDITVALAWSPEEKERRKPRRRKLALLAAAVLVMIAPLPWMLPTWAPVIWRSTPAQISQTLTTDGAVSSVAFLSDGMQVAAGGVRGVRIWDLKSGSVLRAFGIPASSGQMTAFAPNREWIVSADGTTAGIWDLATGRLLHSFAMSAGGLRTIAASTTDMQLAANDNSDVLLWDAKSGQIAHRLQGHSGAVNSVAFSPDGIRIVSGSDDTTLKVWDVGSGRLLVDAAGDAGSIRAVVISADGSRIVSGSAEGAIKIWDAGNGQQLRSLERQDRPIRALALTVDGTEIASGVGDTVVLWDAANGKLLRKLTGHTKQVTSLAFAPDSSQIISGSEDGTIKLWNLKSEPTAGSGKAKE
jgi:WD40 repeat protein